MHITSLRVDTSVATFLLFINVETIIEIPVGHPTALETHGEAILTLIVLTKTL
jgi:hypothetical protein